MLGSGGQAGAAGKASDRASARLVLLSVVSLVLTGALVALIVFPAVRC